MPSKLIRVTLDMASNGFSVEYGEVRAASLTFVQADEREKLIEELKGFTEFATAEKIEDEDRKGLVEKKRRLEELNEMEEMEHIDWYPLEEHLIESLLIVVSPAQLHTYVENIPAYLLDRILDPKGNVVINVGAPSGEPVPPLDLKKVVEDHGLPPDLLPEDVGALESHTENEVAAITAIAQDTPNWAELITVREMPERRLVFVRPNKFLGPLWKPINRALQDVYGECWYSEGTGDKDAHWELPT